MHLVQYPTANQANGKCYTGRLVVVFFNLIGWGCEKIYCIILPCPLVDRACYIPYLHSAVEELTGVVYISMMSKIFLSNKKNEK